MKRHPAAIARDEWFATDQGKSCEEPTTLGVDPTQRQFLRNRLDRALQAGYDAAVEVKQKEIDALETENEQLRTVDKPQIMLDQLDKELDTLAEDYPDFPLIGTLTRPANVVRGARIKIGQLERALKYHHRGLGGVSCKCGTILFPKQNND